jgi:two-component system CheB/CheR fusion protein
MHSENNRPAPEPHSPEVDHLVVVGSSAGGIEALGVLLSGLSDTFPAPVVIAQHLDPNRPSLLPGILERRSAIPVVTVAEDTKLVPGHVYVVPSNRHVVIRDGSVGLEADHGERPRPSVDLLLSTAARSYGDRLIAVILTGSGTDGAEGAVEVKEAGGCVVIQNPRTAAHPSMPAALPPTAVDHVADLEQIAPLLDDILRGAVIEKRIGTVDRGAVDQVLAMVTRQANIDFRQYKPKTILRRISRRMALNHLHSLEEYRDHLETHPQEVGALVQSLLIKVTDFFRDTEAFALLEQEILPKLIERGRERGRVLRLWSAGCATGEEAYSLAILIASMLSRELPEWSVRIFATDVDEEAVSYARRGVYPPSVLRPLRAEHKARFFEPADHGLRITKSLRQMIIFGQQDLTRGAPFPRIDLISCRNLLIYFKPELQHAMLDLFAYSLHQTQGYLFLGKAETARPTKSTYELINKKWKIYRCVSGPLPVPIRPMVSAGPAGDTVLSGAEQEAEGRGRREATIGDEIEVRRVNELFLRSLPLGICVIDRSYKILSMNPSARRLLGVREAATDHDFLHTARGLPYRDVRSGIDRTFRERTVTVLPHLEMGSTLGEARFLTIQIVPFEGAGVEAALVCIENATELVQNQRRLDAVQSEHSQLADELGAANQRLTDINKDLQDANEELQAANEEMMLTQEELQATNEEFEATNEELQATNEELETNNEELQATNEELDTTNEELQARTTELQELTRMLTGERVRLTEIVEKAPFYVLVLRGPALQVDTVNPPLAAMFYDGPVGNRPFDDVCTDTALAPLRSGVRRAFADGRPWYSEWIPLDRGGQRRSYQFTAVPTHDADGSVSGVVVYVEDVTDRQVHEEAEKLGKIKLMLDHASQLAMGLFDTKGKLIHASAQYLAIVDRLKRVAAAEAIGQSWDHLWFGTPDVTTAFADVVRQGRPEHLNEVRATVDHTPSVWDCTLIPIAREPGGQVDYVVLSAVEVTRPVLAREALEQVNRLKDNFLSLASHELRTPLTPLAAYVEMLAHLLAEKRRDPEWDRQVGDVLTKFRQQIGYMARLTEDLVDMSRIRSGKLSLDLKPVDLRRVVEEGRDQAALLDGNAVVRLEMGENGDLTTMADELRLAQVVYNLVSNAIKHAPASGDILVRVSSRTAEGQRWGRIEVRDAGPGIPSAYRDDLFERFLSPTSIGRAARAGLGLGLFISAKIVEQHRGRIGVDHLDPGTSVWFEVPLAGQRAGSVPESRAASSSR